MFQEQAQEEKVSRTHKHADAGCLFAFQQWLDLSLKHQVPATLLLLSRVLYLPENIPEFERLKAVLEGLPGLTFYSGLKRRGRGEVTIWLFERMMPCLEKSAEKGGKKGGNCSSLPEIGFSVTAFVVLVACR